MFRAIAHIGMLAFINMTIQDQIIEFAERYSLKEKALASVDKYIVASIKADKEVGIDFLGGYDKSDLIYEFGRYEFQIDKNNNYRFATRINIYSNKLYGPNFDVPVGYYVELTSLTGEHIDEFLVFDWSPIKFNIECHIERINKLIPQRYFKRNIPEYEFATYVNHVISLTQGKEFNGAIIFVKRCLDYLEDSKNEEIAQPYLNECQDLFKGLYQFVKNNELIDSEMLTNYKIEERIKTKS